ncbi:MAG: hypothetical protein AAF583_14535 [Pseudomonadota bacterium]
MGSKRIALIASALILAMPVNADVTKSGAPCKITEFSVYFAPQETGLSTAAERAVVAEAEEISACSIAQISASVVSADARSFDESHALSSARATSVLAALVSSDIATPDHTIPVNTIPTAETSEEFSAPMARRVDVRIVPMDALNS